MGGRKGRGTEINYNTPMGKCSQYDIHTAKSSMNANKLHETREGIWEMMEGYERGSPYYRYNDGECGEMKPTITRERVQ